MMEILGNIAVVLVVVGVLAVVAVVILGFIFGRE